MHAISLGAHDLELRVANKHATSLPGDSETEYSDGNGICKIYKTSEALVITDRKIGRYSNILMIAIRSKELLTPCYTLISTIVIDKYITVCI